MAFGLPVAVTLAAAAWIVFGPKRRGPTVVEGAETIAVLPFSATGAGVELMGEGMVDLLSTNLNAVGGIKAVDPRIVLSRWKKSGATGGADVETALRIARSVKAQAALVGSIVATGSRVRVSADLYGPEGKSLAKAAVDGAADSVLSLVDELSRSLVKEIWRSKEPVPSLRVSGLTTNSLDAMREYLVGEQFYRRSEWDSAGAAFQRAIDQDSTFALAHYRLAMALGWKGGYGLPRARDASAAALRFSSRMPPRERALIAAYQLFSQGKLAAVDSARAYVATYPDDIEGWYLLGETQYHTRERTGVDPVTIEGSFEKVVAADSTLTPALIHPLELSIASLDSVRFGRYLALLRNGASPDEYEAYRAAGALVFQNRAPDTLATRLLGGHGGAVMAGFAAVHKEADAGSDKILARLGSLSSVMSRNNPDAAKLQLATARGLVLSSLGRFKEASKLADSLKPVSQEQSGAVRLFPYMLGFAPPGYEKDYMAKFDQAPISNPFGGYITAVIHLAQGDGPRGGRIIDSLLAADTTKFPPPLMLLLHGARGWHSVIKGDTAKGLAEMSSALAEQNQMGSFMVSPLRLQYAAILASRPATRAQGIALLSNGFSNELGFLPMANYALAKAYEAAGDKAKAAEAYGRFLHQWDKADESARPRVDGAKEALAKLAGEG
ncbi:MAG TPA: hypothetical protein VLD58_06420, partial [Gemmatimonadales bacterium]|nr:hypothetical protein [Gemmatimonadales bacterium]